VIAAHTTPSIRRQRAEKNDTARSVHRPPKVGNPAGHPATECRTQGSCVSANVAYPVESTAKSLSRKALGLGLRPSFYKQLFENPPELEYFEIISENFLRADGPPLRILDAVRSRHPIVLHGVSLNLLGHAPLDTAYLENIAGLANRVDAPFVSDHLCWTGAHGIAHHDLLPTPYTNDLVAYAVGRANVVQTTLGRPFGIENLSTYVEFSASTMTEWEFYTRVVKESGCWFMLDINNIYVSSVNHGFDPHTYIEAIDFSRVLQVHIAGHTVEANGTIVDTHDRHVSDEVWALYRDAWRFGGPFPTLLEWDAAIPPLPVLLQEIERARTYQT
jgi:uncharacterized protein